MSGAGPAGASGAPVSVVVAAPYPEGAAIELARTAETDGSLATLIMPSRGLSRLGAGVARALRRPDVARRLLRGANDVAAEREIIPLFELMRLAGRVPFVPSRVGDIHRLKALFDDVVARSDLGAATALVSMPEAALHSFERHTDVLRVFHEVDGHPRARNEVLIAHYGPVLAARESHSAAIVERIEAELALADVVLSPSGAVSSQMTEHGVPAAKLVQSYFGVDFGSFASPGEGTGAGGARGGRPVLLYVGQISLRKGIPFLLDAAAGLPVQVRLVGPIVDASILEHTPSNVEYVGVRSHDGIVTEMQAADAFVFPTLEDAFGLVVIEAAASGLPVISTPAAGAAEVLDDADWVSVPPGDVPQLREAMSQVEPLGADDRGARAARLRARRTNGTVNDWPAWSRDVLAGIAARS